MLNLETKSFINETDADVAIAAYQLKVKNRRDVGDYIEQNVYTPNDLIMEMLIKVVPKLEDNVVVMYTLEVLPILKSYGYENVVFTTKEYCEYSAKAVKVLGYKYILMDDIDMKFDVCIMNPPYSKGGNKHGRGGRNIYPEFYKWSLNNATTVAAIMPINIDNKSLPVSQEVFANSVVKHSSFISDNLNDVFSVYASGTIRYCISQLAYDSGKRYQSVKREYVLTEGYTTINDNINLFRGTPALACKENKTEDGVVVYEKIKDGQLIESKISKDIVDAAKGSNAPWLVLTINGWHGREGNSIVVENKGVKFSNNIFAYECFSEEQAIKLKEWMSSDTYVKALVANDSHPRDINVTSDLRKSLPYYE